MENGARPAGWQNDKREIRGKHMQSFDELIRQIEIHKEKGFILEAYHQGEAFKRYELIEKKKDRWIILYGDRNKGIPLCESWLECPLESSIQKMIEEQERGVVYPNEGICHYWSFVESNEHKYDMLVIGYLSLCDLIQCRSLF